MGSPEYSRVSPSAPWSRSGPRSFPRVAALRTVATATAWTVAVAAAPTAPSPGPVALTERGPLVIDVVRPERGQPKVDRPGSERAFDPVPDLGGSVVDVVAPLEELDEAEPEDGAGVFRRIGRGSISGSWRRRARSPLRQARRGRALPTPARRLASSAPPAGAAASGASVHRRWASAALVVLVAFAALIGLPFVAVRGACRVAVAGRGVEDRVDEVGLAETGDALDAHRAGDRVELLTILAVEHRTFELLLGHVLLLGSGGPVGDGPSGSDGLAGPACDRCNPVAMRTSLRFEDQFRSRTATNGELRAETELRTTPDCIRRGSACWGSGGVTLNAS